MCDFPWPFLSTGGSMPFLIATSWYLVDSSVILVPLLETRPPKLRYPGTVIPKFHQGRFSLGRNFGRTLSINWQPSSTMITNFIGLGPRLRLLRNIQKPTSAEWRPWHCDILFSISNGWPFGVGIKSSPEKLESPKVMPSPALTRMAPSETYGAPIIGSHLHHSRHSPGLFWSKARRTLWVLYKGRPRHTVLLVSEGASSTSSLIGCRTPSEDEETKTSQEIKRSQDYIENMSNLLTLLLCHVFVW